MLAYPFGELLEPEPNTSFVTSFTKNLLEFGKKVFVVKKHIYYLDIRVIVFWIVGLV